MSRYLCLMMSLMALSSSAAAGERPAKVKLDSGVVVGTEDAGILRFKGIPFAKPPVGELRWTPAVPPDAWAGERAANKFALPCPQPVNADGKPNGGGVSGEYSEDCLYLNVWAPAKAKHAPVMVWLYGGASFLGAGHLGSYESSAFARDGVIVVTINYRLGALGMFAHPALTKAASASDPLGNYALTDAMEALRWVRRNIGKFGGDAGNVTLFGQSAGGAMTVAMLTIPAAKGLFHKAIVQSGAILRGGPTLEEAAATGATMATALGLPGADATLAQLRAVPAKSFVETEAAKRGIFGVIDGRLRTQAPEDAFAAGNAIDVPLMIGSNNGERGADAARKIASYASAGAPSFLYQFAYVPDWRKEEQPQGAIHSAELVYVFESWATSAYGGPKVTPREHEVSARVHSCWVAFAKSAPDARALRCADAMQWPAYTDANDAIAVFRERSSIQKAAELPVFVPPPTPSA
jgi:para-nitrobenzyl esterase